MAVLLVVDIIQIDSLSFKLLSQSNAMAKTTAFHIIRRVNPPRIVLVLSEPEASVWLEKKIERTY